MPKTVEQKILYHVNKALYHFKMIEPDDHLLVAFSGGKDSWSLLHILRLVQKKSSFLFFIFCRAH